MSNIEKIINKILTAQSDNNIDFNDFRKAIASLGFNERIKGSHHIFSKDNFPEIVNIQPIGIKAKAYQVKQFRNLILKYNLYNHG